MNLDTSLQLAEKLADVSGEIITQYFRQARLPTETKEEQVSSIVTIADREAEEAMVTLLRAEAPEDGIIREEGENVDSQSGRYWVLDPIDGTSSFVRGLPIFGTLIGLVAMETQTTLLGVVNQPILQERWSAIAGRPTRLNGKIIENPYTQDTSSPLGEACLTSTTPLMFLSEHQQAIARSLQNVCKRTAFGGDCYNYVSLATGWGAMPLVVLEADLQYYDFCALIPILEGAGSYITDWQGQALTPESREVIAASNRVLLEQVLRVIKLTSSPPCALLKGGDSRQVEQT